MRGSPVSKDTVQNKRISNLDFKSFMVRSKLFLSLTRVPELVAGDHPQTLTAMTRYALG